MFLCTCMYFCSWILTPIGQEHGLGTSEGFCEKYKIFHFQIWMNTLSFCIFQRRTGIWLSINIIEISLILKIGVSFWWILSKITDFWPENTRFWWKICSFVPEIYKFCCFSCVCTWVKKRRSVCTLFLRIWAKVLRTCSLYLVRFSRVRYNPYNRMFFRVTNR